MADEYEFDVDVSVTVTASSFAEAQLRADVVKHHIEARGHTNLTKAGMRRFVTNVNVCHVEQTSYPD